MLGVDDKSQLQALDRSAPVRPMMPGPERRTHDHVRHGLTTLCAAFNIAEGTVGCTADTGPWSSRNSSPRSTRPSRRNWTSPSWAPTPGPQDPGDQGLAGRPPRFHVHSTPTGSSWINRVERWFAFLTGQMIRRGVHRSGRALGEDIRVWIEDRNANPRPFVWTKTAEEILDSLARYLRRISGAAH